jgi:RsiW-degrading membrane proteinase PrsW (M82 family)
MVSSSLFLFALGVFPALFWLGFFLIEDYKHPEPPRMIAKVFIAGALSALVAAVMQFGLQISAPKIVGSDTGSLVGFFAFAFIEEAVKFGGAYLLIRRSTSFDEPVDAMIYLITAAMGFAALENALFLLSAGSSMILKTALMRSIGATFLHAVASGFVGFYWARKRLVWGLIIATVVHTGFNCLVYYFAQTQIYAITFVLLASFFLFHDFDIIKQS